MDSGGLCHGNPDSTGVDSTQLNASPFISQLGDNSSDTNADNGQTSSGYKDLEEDCKPFN